MANISETADWVDGVYQIETSDPISGGPNGIDNLPHKHLAARTRYLKMITDEVIAARGGYPTLLEHLEIFDASSVDTVNAIIALSMEALGQAGLANRELDKLQHKRIQSGLVTIKNRGVISGCAVSRSGSANRNLAISAGACFVWGRVLPVLAEDAGASVPPNPGTTSQVCYAYLYVNTSGQIVFACTSLGEAIPDDGVGLCQLTVPAGNTDATDPALANVTLTDIRRMEPNYPTWFASAPHAPVALPYALLDSNYIINLDVVSLKGVPLLSGGDLYIGSRNVNGFNIYYNGIADSIQVRWSIRHDNL